MFSKEQNGKISLLFERDVQQHNIQNLMCIFSSFDVLIVFHCLFLFMRYPPNEATSLIYFIQKLNYLRS